MLVRIVGRGRAGGAFAEALGRRGVDVELVPGSAARIDGDGADLVLLCVPDDAIAGVAERVAPGRTVVAHCSGSRTLAVLAGHERRASMHPLMSLPNAMTGADRLLDQCTFAVAGDPLARALVDVLGGVAIDVPDDRRAAYHAAACVAANHLVVLCAQVERLAESAGVPVEAYWTMMRHSLENVTEAGAAASLTGPAARGDAETIAVHLAALAPAERELYRTLADAAARLGTPEV